MATASYFFTMVDFKYRPDVDGLRAVAVGLVLLYHAGLGFSGGYVGVDVFFVISGFLITGLILKEQRARKFRLSQFWIRRVRRIIPASMAMALITLVVGGWLLLPSDYEELGQSTLAQQLMLSNFYFWQHTGYFDGPAELKPLLHTWSLAVEEQFYLVYPFLLVLLRRFHQRRQAALLLGLAALSFAVSELGVRNFPSAAFFLLPTRAWELLLGALICFAPAPTGLGKWQANLLSAVGIVAIVLSGWLYSQNTAFPGTAALLPCGGAALLIYSCSHRLTWVGRALATRPFVFVGLISYSLYLWHWPILASLRYLHLWTVGHLGELPVSIRLLALGASFLAAYLSWRLIELPFREKRVLADDRRACLTAACSAALAVSCCLLIVMTAGMKYRFDPRVDQYYQVKESKDFRHNISLEQARNGRLPRFGAADAPLRCLVWGDSHAMHLVAVLYELSDDYDMQCWQATHSSTAPLLNFQSVGRLSLKEQSVPFGQAVFQNALDNDVNLVVLAGAWSAYVDDPGFSRCVQGTVRQLNESGIRVVIVRDVPAHQASVPMLLAKAVMEGQSVQEVGVPLTQHRMRNRKCDLLFDRLADELDVTVLDPAPYFEDDRGLLRAELDGQALYSDSHHLSRQGALRLRPMFERLVQRECERAVAKSAGKGGDGDNGRRSRVVLERDQHSHGAVSGTVRMQHWE